MERRAKVYLKCNECEKYVGREDYWYKGEDNKIYCKTCTEKNPSAQIVIEA